MPHVILDLCSYCERSPRDLVQEGLAEEEDEALQYYKVGENQVLLCGECAERYADENEFNLDALASCPITFPPGVTAVEHTCPALELQGKLAEQATVLLQLTRNGDYNVVTCEHCGVTVRSLAEDDL
jgi:hypothetical protein